MDDLVQFLRARLDEDEQTARRASPGPWKPNAEHDEVVAVGDVTVAEGFALSGQQLRATVDHIARHDPARVLAEVEAKRQIIEQHERYAAERRRMMGGWDPQSDDSPILAALAAVYADHPDYRPEWRP